MDLRQTEKYANFMRSIGWKVERINNINYFIRPFWIFGSFMKIQRPEKVNTKVIKDLSAKYKVFRVILEPKNRTPASKYRVTAPYLPSKTIHIDLTKPEKSLLKNMHQKTRYNIQHAQKLGVKITESKDINLFINLWKNAKFSRKIMSAKDITELYKAFGKDAHLLLAYKEGNLLSGVLSIHTKKVAYYMYAATNSEGRKNYAPTLITWEHIKLAKKNNCKVFDFEGIYDGRFPLESWKGFTRFKKGFGGKEVKYPGAYLVN